MSRRKFAHFRCVTVTNATLLANIYYTLHILNPFLCHDAFYASKSWLWNEVEDSLLLTFFFSRMSSSSSFKEANEPKSEVDNDIIGVKADLFQKMWNWRWQQSCCCNDASSCVTTSSWSVFWCQESFLTTRPFVLWKSHRDSELDRTDLSELPAAQSKCSPIVICKVPITNSRTAWTCSSSNPKREGSFCLLFISNTLLVVLLQCLNIKGPRISPADQNWLTHNEMKCWYVTVENLPTE